MHRDGEDRARQRRAHRHRHPRWRGRHIVTLGTLALIAVSGYELWIRLEDFWAWSAGVRHLSEVRGTPFIQDMAIIFETPEMRALAGKLLFLLGAIVFAAICLARRNRTTGAWALIVLDLALAAGGVALGVYGLHPSEWAQTAKLLPLAAILVGVVMNLADRAVRRYKRKKRKSRAEQP